MAACRLALASGAACPAAVSVLAVRNAPTIACCRGTLPAAGAGRADQWLVTRPLRNRHSLELAAVTCITVRRHMLGALQTGCLPCHQFPPSLPLPRDEKATTGSLAHLNVSCAVLLQSRWERLHVQHAIQTSVGQCKPLYCVSRCVCLMDAPGSGQAVGAAQAAPAPAGWPLNRLWPAGTQNRLASRKPSLLLSPMACWAAGRWPDSWTARAWCCLCRSRCMRRAAMPPQGSCTHATSN